MSSAENFTQSAKQSYYDFSGYFLFHFLLEYLSAIKSVSKLKWLLNIKH